MTSLPSQPKSPRENNNSNNHVSFCRARNVENAKLRYVSLPQNPLKAIQSRIIAPDRSSRPNGEIVAAECDENLSPDTMYSVTVPSLVPLAAPEVLPKSVISLLKVAIMRLYNNRMSCANCGPKTFDSKTVCEHVGYPLKMKTRIMRPLRSPSWAKNLAYRKSAVL